MLRATHRHSAHARRAPPSSRPAGGEVGQYLSRMTRPTDAQAQTWMSQWRTAGVALARIRAAELEEVGLWRVADELDEALWARVRAEPVSLTSGLVEQQRLFARAGRP